MRDVVRHPVEIANDMLTSHLEQIKPGTVCNSATIDSEQHPKHPRPSWLPGSEQNVKRMIDHRDYAPHLRLKGKRTA